MKRSDKPKTTDQDRRPVAKEYIKDLQKVADSPKDVWDRIHKAIKNKEVNDFRSILVEEVGLNEQRVNKLILFLWPPRNAHPTEACW